MRFASGIMVLIFSLMLVSDTVMAQGITRSKGIGLRGSFWKSDGDLMSINVNAVGTSSSVNVGGVGVTLFFFSRLTDHFFLETSIGSSANVQTVQYGLFEQSTKTQTLTPFLFGLRYDIFPPTMESIFQPYLATGTGPYLLMNTSYENKSLLENDVTIQSDLYSGGFFGTGVYFILKDWFALNTDIRHHWVNWDVKNPNSGFEFSLGACFMFGKKQEIFQVQEIQVVVEDIYPAYYQFYRTYPVALISIRNTSHYPIEVKILSEMDGFSERPYESGFTQIQKGEVKHIPVHLILGRNIYNAVDGAAGVLDLEIEARAGVAHSRTVSTQITLHSKNAWDGDIQKLGFYITPENPSVLSISREVARQFASVTDQDRQFLIAQSIIDSLGSLGIQYQNDPNIPYYEDDRVQFAEYTIEQKSGDCDDLTVLCASLLEGAGIRTAFVDVHDPKKSMAHLYLLFDTGLSPNEGHLISSNEKRYILRETEDYKTTIWIPVESTLIQNGFTKAWNQGAMQYLEEGVLRNGLTEGWMQIVDVRNIRNIF